MILKILQCVLCSLLVRIMLCPNIHSSHQKEQHWKQYKVWALRLSQFPHFTLVVLHSFIAKTSSKLLIRKLVGSSLGFPLPGIWNCLLHSGHVILPWMPLVRWIPFRQWRQKLCKQGNCLGSVNVHIHTEQDTSSWRLFNKVFISMEKVGNKVTFQKFWPICWRSREWLCEWTRKSCLVTQTKLCIINQSNSVSWHVLMVWRNNNKHPVFPRIYNQLFVMAAASVSARGGDESRGRAEKRNSFGKVC